MVTFPQLQATKIASPVALVPFSTESSTYKEEGHPAHKSFIFIRFCLRNFSRPAGCGSF
jgi:hypothetical protein